MATSHFGPRTGSQVADSGVLARILQAFSRRNETHSFLAMAANARFQCGKRGYQANLLALKRQTQWQASTLVRAGRTSECVSCGTRKNSGNHVGESTTRTVTEISAIASGNISQAPRIPGYEPLVSLKKA